MIQPVFPRFCHPWSTLSSHLFPINVPFCSVVFLGFFPPSYCSMFYFSLVHDSPHQGSLILLGTNFYFDLWNLTLLCPLCTHPPLLCTNPFSPFVCVCVCRFCWSQELWATYADNLEFADIFFSTSPWFYFEWMTCYYCSFSLLCFIQFLEKKMGRSRLELPFCSYPIFGFPAVFF